MSLTTLNFALESGEHHVTSGLINRMACCSLPQGKTDPGGRGQTQDHFVPGAAPSCLLHAEPCTATGA